MPMSSGGRVASSSGCATKPKAREIGWTGYAGLTQHSLRIGHYVMATAEHREPCDSRGSCTVLGAPGGEIPPGDTTETAVPARRRRCRSASISGPPAETALQATARAVDATRVPHPGRANSASDSFPLGRSRPRFDYYVRRIIMRRSHAGNGEDSKMQRSMTRIRTSHVGRLPPPKGWEDMPGRLASAEITDPAVIAAQITPTIAETVRRQVEVGIDCIGDRSEEHTS